ncbi:MAG: phytoene desaturase [Endomicrobiales bacterium]|nr:phytoene desaturase [Endomicrobiales bacterium]
MQKKKIVIVGAGPGGLTAGMLLASRGFDVTVFEREDDVGGRNRSIKSEGYTFDTGPTFLMMQFILEEIFEMTNRKASDYIKIVKLDPMYRLKFDDFEFLPTNNKETMKKRIKSLFPGNENGLDKFHEKEKVRFEKMYPCLQLDYSYIYKFFHPNLLKALPYLSLGQSLFNNLGKYFNKEKLKLSFTFQSKYLGMSPWECPAAFTLIPYIEHTYGIYHVIGGLNQISQAMKRVIEEEGGKVVLNARVRELLIESNKTRGVVLENGEKVSADEVVVNADFAYAMANMVRDGVLKKYSIKNLKRKKYSCSTFMLYLGVDKKYDIPHHNIFFAKDYRSNIEDIFNRKKLSDDMSFYIQNACVSDSTLAPNGCSTIYVLVPVANMDSNIDWDKEKKVYRDKIINEIVRRTEMKDIENHIKFEKVITPDEWQDDYNIFFGATFNLAHGLFQMLYFRPHNKFEELDNLYIVGGGTHPGSGLPTIYESGRISSNMISKKYGVKYKNSSLKEKYGS